MSVFLFLKPFVDLLYGFQWLDVAMVVLAVCMLFYQYLLVRPDVKKMFRAADAAVLLLVLCLTAAFLRDTATWQTYIKVLSAFLMYFMGRLYYDRILECGDALALSSYLIIYINFIHRILTFGSKLLQVTNADGDLYFYDTDLAYAMVLAFIFVSMFARNSVFKYVTLLLVCPYMIFWSDAGIQMVLFLAVVLVLVLYILEVALHRKTFAMIGMGALIAGLLLCVVFLYLPVFTGNASGITSLFGDNSILNVTHMETRYAEWQEVFAVRRPEGAAEVLFGLGLNTQLPLKSLYLKAFYSIGVLGAAMGVLLIIFAFHAANRTQERKSFYITMMLAILMLGSGVTFNTMETTQMSWFVMLFAGMVISSQGQQTEQ
ncbi:MAG: hypothetical protein K6B72_08690 [Lachnospiraceae bacterium]|nr:hypothetical protein [Lachnospiraceae bacterium]